MGQDIQKLQGTWHVHSLELDGSRMPASSGAKIVITGDRFTTVSMGAEYEGILEIDEAPTPKAFNLKFTAGPEKGNTNPGIYELGGDTWTICLNVAGKLRPTGFVTSRGSGNALEILGRKEPALSEASSGEPASGNMEPPHPDAGELAGEWSMVSGTMDGHPLEPSMVKYGRRVATATEVKVLFGQQVAMKARFHIDPSKTPKAVDLTHSAGMNAGQTQHGIYKLEGKVLTTCFSAPGRERPSDFASTQGYGRLLTVWTK